MLCRIGTRRRRALQVGIGLDRTDVTVKDEWFPNKICKITDGARLLTTRKIS